MLKAFDDALIQQRSWAKATAMIDVQTVSLTISKATARFNLGWHESDAGQGNCVRVDGAQMWARPEWTTDTWTGPYHLVGKDSAGEAAHYLNEYLAGCYSSREGEQWCLTPTGLSIDGQPFPSGLQMDLSEVPDYGTAIRVEGRRLPFLVFVPRPGGWAVYEDNWASAPGNVVVDAEHDAPWRQLTALRAR